VAAAAPVAVSQACSASTMSGGCGGRKLLIGDATNDAAGAIPRSWQYLRGGDGFVKVSFGHWRGWGRARAEEVVR
jgi:hypothetical protein